jgi:hypothetical protein
MNRVLLFYFLFITWQLNAQMINHQSTTGPTPPKGINTIGHVSDEKNVTTQQVITGVPAYLWHHGCGPTSVGMVLGYYDMHGFANLIPGSSSTQTTPVNTAIASTENYDDYASPEDNYPTLLPDKSELPTGDEHINNCIADYMFTSQSYSSNYYGWSWSSDIGPAWLDYIYYDTDPNYTGVCSPYDFVSFPWDSLVNNVNNNHPMVFLVDTDGDGSTDHFICVVGYKTDLGINYYGCFDTWDSNLHWYQYLPMAGGTPWGIYSCYTFGISDISGINEYNNDPTITLSVFPNPFVENTQIHFSLKKANDIRLFISDVSGKIIKVLQQGKLNAGDYNISWDANDENVHKLSKGSYYVCLQTSKNNTVKKLLYIK